MSHEAKSTLKLSAPPQARIAKVIDDYHGRQIADPYRWLEGVSGRDELRRRIEQLLTIGRVACPRVGGKRYFYERRDGRQNQAVVYVREGRAGQGLQNSDRALIDVNNLAPDGTIALDWWYPSEDGRQVAFGTS